MKNELKEFLSRVELGQAQAYKQIMVVPIIGPGDDGPVYLTLDESLASQQVTVTEVSQGGSVPELRVVNQAPAPVLLLDGEELAGAKQNRVLNTTILLKEHSETVIPVSCTEQGRWAYASAQFGSSGYIMSQQARSLKSSSVSESLAARGKYSSDQGEVWHHIAALHAKSGTHSPTGAMRDAFAQRKTDLDAATKAFTCVPGQTGLVVLVSGEVTGFDTLSRSQAYGQLHSKLLQSYLIDALLEPGNVPPDPPAAREKSRAFLEELAQCDERPFPSLGHGVDYRLQKPDLAGTALVHEGQVVHLAAFRMKPTGEAGGMAPWRMRRRHFSG